MKSWQGTEKEGLTISVNISVSDMVHLDIFDTITDIVARHGIDPRQLKLEITETTLMGDIEKYRVLIGRLQEAGFEVEIDDFGSGYSSLSMLKDIEADILKIDMGYPSHEEELEILSRYNAGVDLRDVSALQPVISAEELLEMRKMLPQVVADERILHYITGLIEGTRTSPLLDLGASPRASVALLRCAKAVALLAGRDFVIPDDVKEVAPAVLCHRLSLTPDAEMNGYTAARIVGALLESTEIPQ